MSKKVIVIGVAKELNINLYEFLRVADKIDINIKKLYF